MNVHHSALSARQSLVFSASVAALAIAFSAPAYADEQIETVTVTAEKRSSTNRLKKLFSQFCAPVGKANLFIDKPERAFVLKDIKIETHCKGVLGWFVNFLTPLLTKTYGDMKLFQMPPSVPLTVDSVRGGAHLVEIGGSIDWTASKGKPEVPPKPQPVVASPGK